MKKRPTYLRAVVAALGTMLKGMRLSGRHLRKGYHRPEPLGVADPNYFQQTQGPITIQYPMEKVPVPDNGRYRLYMETEDCIGCDKCARICPVDCITIETFRADGDLGRTSDGTVKRLHLPTFDIDMAKCMYCGLCTTVCPTECLTMSPVYDYSEYDRDNFLYHFGAYSPAEDQRIREATEQSLAAKKSAKAIEATPEQPASEEKPKGRPMMRPLTKSVESAPSIVEPQLETEASEQPSTDAPRPRPRPMMKRTEATPASEESDSPKAETPATEDAPPRPRPKPIMKRPEDAPVTEESDSPKPETPPTTPPRARPIMKRREESPSEEPAISESPASESLTPPAEKPAPRPRPIMKPKAEEATPATAQVLPEPPAPSENPAAESPAADEPPVPPKARPRPIMRRPENPAGGPEA